MAIQTIRTPEEELREVNKKKLTEDYKKLAKTKDTIEKRLEIIEKLLGLE